MKVIILNRKRLGVIVVIIGLMLVLFGLEAKFAGRLKYAALVQNNINSLKEYQGLEKHFSYKLPSKWTTQESKFPSDEVLYHNEFSSEDAKIHGMVEVWSLKEDLKDFLDNSKKVADKYNSYKNYSITPININNQQGYVLNYTMETSPNTCFKAYEYFIKDKGKFIRFSFYVRDENFQETMPTIFQTIVETFKYKD